MSYGKEYSKCKERYKKDDHEKDESRGKPFVDIFCIITNMKTSKRISLGCITMTKSGDLFWVVLTPQLH